MLRTKTVDLEDRGRVLRFEIRELPAMRLENWLHRMADALAPEETPAALEGVGSVPELENLLNTQIDFQSQDRIRLLMNELLECCRRVDVDPPVQLSADNVDDHIFDLSALIRLRQEVMELNLDFFGIAGREPLVSK